MTKIEKAARLMRLARDLQPEDNEAIIQSRIVGLSTELGVNPFYCALMFWTLKESGQIKQTFGDNVKVRFNAR